MGSSIARRRRLIVAGIAASSQLALAACGGGWIEPSDWFEGDASLGRDAASEGNDAAVDGIATPNDAAPKDAASKDATLANDSGVDAQQDGSLDLDAAYDAESEDASDSSLPACANADIATGSTAVGFQIDSQHSGAQSGDALSLPLCRRWVHDFVEGDVSYSVVVGGRVFVLVGNSQSTGASLFALDQHSGQTLWGPINVESAEGYGFAALAYGDGQLYTINETDILAAWQPSNGTQLWSLQLGQQFSFAPPTTGNGMVFVNGAEDGDTIFAVTSDGSLAWFNQTNGSRAPGATVTDGAVFVSYGCGLALSYLPSDGGLLWTTIDNSFGGGPGLETGAFIDSRLFGAGFDAVGHVFDPTDGGIVNNWGPDGGILNDYLSMPAGDETAIAFVEGSVLMAENPADSSSLWTFAGDNEIVGRPIKVGGNFVVGSRSGMLYVVSAADGSLVSSDQFDGPFHYDNYSQPIPGITEADGMMFVAAGSKLVAY